MIRMPIRASHISLAGSLALAGLAAPAAAQDVPNQEGADSEAAPVANDSDEGAIIVTARRREENLVDVPIAVTEHNLVASSNAACRPCSPERSCR